MLVGAGWTQNLRVYLRDRCMTGRLDFMSRGERFSLGARDAIFSGHGEHGTAVGATEGWSTG
jgi:hypothetical protein